MSKYFEGYYFKHQKDNNVLCLIVGKSNSEEFIQVITNDFSCNVPLNDNITFLENKLSININTKEISLTGNIIYEDLSPIKYDIMGPFKYFPMECSHGIVSMHHRLKGKVILNGDEIDFTDGIGYIEKDSGTSFPSSYAWIQANDFNEKCSIMAAVADIPFLGFSFNGCICIIQYKGKEYRLATYLGVKVVSCNKDEIILKQGKYNLLIRVDSNSAYELSAPNIGEMTRTIIETPACNATFSFSIGKKQIFNLKSTKASFEYEKSCDSMSDKTKKCSS